MATRVKIIEIDGEQRSEVFVLSKSDFRTIMKLRFIGGFERFKYEVVKKNVKCLSHKKEELWDKMLKKIFCVNSKHEIMQNFD